MPSFSFIILWLQSSGKDKCSYCGKVCRGATQARNHENWVHKKVNFPYYCTICGKGVTARSLLNGHMASNHGMKKNFQCNFCGREFGYRNKLQEHLKLVHNSQIEHSQDNWLRRMKFNIGCDCIVYVFKSCQNLMVITLIISILQWLFEILLNELFPNVATIIRNCLSRLKSYLTVADAVFIILAFQQLLCPCLFSELHLFKYAIINN